MRYRESIEPHEWFALTEAWGAAPCRRQRLEVDHPFLTGNHQQLLSDGRRAEICYVMHRGEPAAELLLHIKNFYPDGAYRLPTGGIHVGESVLDTLAREIAEETGLTVGDADEQVTVEGFLGAVEYELVHAQLGLQRFATYHFLTRMPPDAVLNPQDPEEEIADWQWRLASALPDVAATLRALGTTAPAWGDWGHFRALSHGFVGEVLEQLRDQEIRRLAVPNSDGPIP